MTEYLMTTNKYGEPEVLKEPDSRGISLLRLLVLTPGHNPLFPRMGCGLIDKRHIEVSELGTLERDIADQIEQYLPECNMDSVELSYDENLYLIVKIQCEGVQYIFNAKDSGLYVKLSDL